MNNFEWQKKQDLKRGYSSIRSIRRSNKKEAGLFRPFIKDKIWWDSLSLEYKIKFMGWIKSKQHNEKEIIRLYPNKEIRRKFLIDTLLK